jgi:hypothetical protein
MNHGLEKLQALLLKRADDPAVIELTNRKVNEINRSAYMGYVTSKDYGLSIIFKEGEWLFEQPQTENAKALYLCAFHLHRATHEGNSQYQGQLPGELVFSDSETEVIRKMGTPLANGGGGYSNTLKKPIPHWLKYRLGQNILHLQFDADRKLEMVTLQAPDSKKGKP